MLHPYLYLIVFAEGMVGTAALLDALGVMNVYYQHKIRNDSSVVVSYGSIDGSFEGGTLKATTLSGSY